MQWRLAAEGWSAARQVELPAGSSSARIDGLEPGEYFVRVLGLRSGNVSEPSAEMRVVLGGGVDGAPEVAAPPATVLLGVGETAEVPLADLFRDPDGDALEYVAWSSAPNVASASALGATLTIEGRWLGVAAVSVTATDPGGLSAQTGLRVEVRCDAGSSAPEGGVAVAVAQLESALRSEATVAWRVAPDGDPATVDADEGEHGGAFGEATIAAGRACARIEIPIADDGDAEPAREWFVVELELRRPRQGSAALARQRLPVAVLEGVCDRTPAVRDALVAATSGDGGCERPTPADLAALRALALGGAGLEALAAGDLGGLSDLRALDLRSNALAGLAAEAVADAPALERLLLGGNALAAVPRQALAALPRGCATWICRATRCRRCRPECSRG